MNTFRERSARVWGYMAAHKAVSIIGLIVIIGGGFFIYKHYSKTAIETRYVLGTVERGTLTATVSGSGQVSASDQIDIKPKASGDVISVPARAGQSVRKGTVIAVLDAGDATKALRDAELNLESAELSYDKTVKPADTITLLQAENALDSAKRSLDDAYANTYASVADAFIDLPDIMQGDENYLLHQNAASYLNSETVRTQGGQEAETLYESVKGRFSSIKDEYQSVLAEYQSTPRTADDSALAKLLADTTTLVAHVGDMSKDLRGVVDSIEMQQGKNSAYATAINADQSTLTGYINTLASDLSSLSSLRDSITNAKESIAEKEQSLANVKAGADSLDIESARLSLVQRQNALRDAQEALGDYTVRAPIDGVLASVDVKVGDAASSGTAAATIITKDQIAELSLNELDAAKIKIGQKATLTFDAIPDLNLSGEVIETDLIGTVTQGVVSYKIKIGFDTQDERIKPGMSISAAIITDSKTDVLMVPNSALKNASDGSATVQILPSPAAAGSPSSAGVASSVPPQNIEVETGLTSDSSTEIVSGLREGQQIIVRTITTSATAAAPTTGNLFGGNRGAGNATRAIGR